MESSDSYSSPHTVHAFQSADTLPADALSTDALPAEALPAEGALEDVQMYLDEHEGERLIGVYALYNSSRQVQYIGYSRSLVIAIKARLQRAGRSRCHLVRTMVFANPATATSAHMAREMQNWLEDCAFPPPGHGAGKRVCHYRLSVVVRYTIMLSRPLWRRERYLGVLHWVFVQ